MTENQDEVDFDFNSSSEEMRESSKNQRKGLKSHDRYSFNSKEMKMLLLRYEVEIVERYLVLRRFIKYQVFSERYLNHRMNNTCHLLLRTVNTMMRNIQQN